MILKKELLLPKQINPWLGVLGTHIEWRRPTYQNIEYFAHMHDQLGMIPEEQKQTFSNSRRQLASTAHELEEIPSFIRTYAS